MMVVIAHVQSKVASLCRRGLDKTQVCPTFSKPKLRSSKHKYLGGTTLSTFAL